MSTEAVIQNRHQTPTSIRKLAFCLFLPLFFWLILVNIQIIVAEFFAIPVRHLLSLENSREWRDRDAVYAAGLSSIEKAIAFQGDNPEYQEIRGRILINRCVNWDITSRWDEWQVCQKNALGAMRAALAANAHSPYLWANLLLVKFNLQQFDAEFDTALENGRNLGPNEFGVNRTLAKVGLQDWLRWNAQQRDLFREAVFALHEASPLEAKKIAGLTGTSSLYCFWTRNDPRQFYSCRKKKTAKKHRAADTN